MEPRSLYQTQIVMVISLFMELVAGFISWDGFKFAGVFFGAGFTVVASTVFVSKALWFIFLLSAPPPLLTHFIGGSLMALWTVTYFTVGPSQELIASGAGENFRVIGLGILAGWFAALDLPRPRGKRRQRRELGDLIIRFRRLALASSRR